jgi:CubicO group peptidase (beta-lactamase class C family)
MFPIVMLSGLCACHAGGKNDMKVPATNSPVMTQARKLLDAINSGDRATLEAYRKKNFSPGWKDAPDVARGLMSHKQFGGFDLVQVDESKPNQMHGWVRARDSDAVLELALDVEPAAPYRLTFLHLDWGNAPEKFRVARLPEAAVIEAWRQDTARRAQEDKFSGAILLTRGDQVLLREAYGFADREAKVPNTVETRFRTASTSKMFTAAAVLRLVQDGKLKLDDRIDEVVPELAGKPIAPATIHQLLSHTAGAGDFFGPRYDAHKKELRVHDDYVRFFGGDALVSKPGEKFQYSNLGYMYLGAAIEHASGRSFYDYLDEAVFKPVGMAHTDTSPPDVDMRGRARGYIRPPGERAWRSAAEFLDYRPDGAGGAWSTVDDLHRFLSALRTHRILDAEHTQLMLGKKTEAWKGHGYGYGVWIDDYPGGGQWTGGLGGEMGSNSEALFTPEAGYMVIVLSNFDPGAAVQVSEFVRARVPLR